MGRLKWDWLATMANDDEIAEHEEFLRLNPQPIEDHMPLTAYDKMVNTVFSLGILDDLRDKDARGDADVFYRRLWERLTPGHLRTLLQCLTSKSSPLDSPDSRLRALIQNAIEEDERYDAFATTYPLGSLPAIGSEWPRVPPVQKPVVFLECPTAYSGKVLERIRNEFENRLGSRYQLVILYDGLKLANQQSWKPDRIDVECGQITIKSGPETGHGSTVTVDGQQMQHVRRIAFELTPNNVPLVNIEFVARPPKDVPKDALG